MNDSNPIKSQLHKRVNFAYNAFQNSMLFERSKKAIFAYASRIHSYQKAHRLLTTHKFTDAQLEKLLACDDPLRLVAEGYHKAHAALPDDLDRLLQAE